MHDIQVPAVGESITEVIVAEWSKPEGSWFAKDETVVTLETDKVNVEVPAPISGYLEKILKSPEDTASVGEVIGHIRAGEAVDAPKADQPQAPAAQNAASATKPDAEARVMPAAQRVLAERDLAPTQVAPSGPGGRLLKEDVLAHKSPSQAQADSQSKSAQASSPAADVKPNEGTPRGAREERRVPMTPLRRRIAERLLASQQNAAILTTFNEVDMKPVMDLRKRLQERFVARHGIKVGFMSFFVKAVVEALREIPELNAEIRGDEIIYRDYCDVGVAVGTDKGLFVPILRDAELLGFAEVEKKIADFGARARSNKLKLDELQGGTFSISNGGVYGSLMSTPILNPPQSGILGMHNIVERPIGVNGQVVLRPMMYIALSYDHRIVDGKQAVTFLKRIKELVEDPTRILLEV